MSEFQAIETVVLQYFTGLHEGDVDLVGQQFLADADIRGYYEGELVNMTLPKYLAMLRQKSSPQMLGEEFDMHIITIGHIGKIANVRTRYLFEALNYIDFLHLLKVDGQWKIASKAFHHD